MKMASSTTTQMNSSPTTNGGTLSRKPQNNTNLPKPKLTGWAQAAARSLPKSPQQQSTQSSSSQQRYVQVSVNATRPSSNSVSNSNSSTSPSLRRTRKQTNGSISGGNTSINNNSYKSKQPYNRDEVRNYMRDLFTQYASSSSISTYNDLNSGRKGGNLDWGTVTSSRYKNKKYGCLNEIAQVLRNS